MKRLQAKWSRRGSATLMTLLLAVTLLGLCGGILILTLGSQKEHTQIERDQRALYVAHSGVSHSISELVLEDELLNDVAQFTSDFGGGGFVADVVDNGDGTYTITSTGTLSGGTETIEAVVVQLGTDLFDHAVFAGNSGGDPSYTLDLGGSDDQADLVTGDVFSGGNVEVGGDAMVLGDIRATGDVLGADGQTGLTQPVPDLDAMNYPYTAEVNVGQEFVDAGFSYSYDNAGGYAYQVAESSPAHIFRINPSDRYSNYSSTEKLDFFLEDPYEPVNSDSSQDGSNPFEISLEEGSNGVVYYIDGNLWLHNYKAYSFALTSASSAGVQVTFVVEGNIYFSDNLFYDDSGTDGVAFIALADDAVEDSGNIYFGDPVFGTLVEMNAYMYAENNFYDYNLDEDGSTTVTVNGLMSAGNQVDIQRDYGDQHTRLVVNFDDRISLGELDMPGLPSSSGGEGGGFRVVSWRTVANP